MSPEELRDKTTLLVQYFVSAMAVAGNPGTQAPDLKHITRNQAHATRWGYSLPSVSIALGGSCWQLQISGTQEPGGFMATYWYDVIITLAGEWVMLGSGFQKFHVAGQMRDIGVPIVLTSSDAGATETILKAVLKALRAALDEHRADAVPGLLAIMDS